MSLIISLKFINKLVHLRCQKINILKKLGYVKNAHLEKVCSLIRKYWPFEIQLEVEMVLHSTGLYKFRTHWPNSQSILTSVAPSSTARLISLQRKSSLLCMSHFSIFSLYTVKSTARQCYIFFWFLTKLAKTWYFFYLNLSLFSIKFIIANNTGCKFLHIGYFLQC